MKRLRTRLMAFLCGISLLILGMLWLFLSRFLQPLYNSYIEKHLQEQVNIVTSLILLHKKPISTRYFEFSAPQLDEAFWQRINELGAQGKIDFSNMCVDIADQTLRYVNYGEGLSPCLLHEAGAHVFSFSPRQQDSDLMISFRQLVMEQGSCTQIIESATTSQMVVGKRVENGEWGSYTVIFSTNLTRVQEAAAVMGQILPFATILLFVLCFLGAAWFSRWFTKPITQLSDATRQMAQGNYGVQVAIPSAAELASLATDFNAMTIRVSQAAQMQKDLLANVSHDLRTPLTLIKGYAETLREITGEDPHKRNEQLGIIVDETDRLSTLVSSVLELSRISSGATALQKEHFDLCELCQSVAARYRQVCAQNEVTFTVYASGEHEVYADAAMLERVLHNLLSNAVQHTPPQGRIVLGVAPTATALRVIVQDNGAGIAKEDLPFIFDRYYRSRANKGGKGTGLGLSITKAILQEHQFRFGVNSTRGEGSTFWFECPL